MRRTGLLGSLPLVVVCVLTACGGGGGGSSGDAAPTTSAPAIAGPAPAPDSGCAPFRGTVRPLTTHGERPPALLVDAYAGPVGCLDRVTFEFQSLGDGTPPGYSVEYRDLDAEPLANEAGGTVQVPGNAWLLVTFTPAASRDTRLEDRPPTYRGNLRLAYDDSHRLEAVLKLPDVGGAAAVGPELEAPDLDGSVQWVIGLPEQRPFVVDAATDPTRVSVYIG